MFRNTRERFVAALGLFAVTALGGVGCSSNPAMAEKNPTIEPDAREAVVMAGPGLGASDSLGQQLFVVPADDTRFAQARIVYEMAMAESSTPLHLDTVPFEDRSATTPRQVIVSGEDPDAEPQEATVTGEIDTELFE